MRSFVPDGTVGVGIGPGFSNGGEGHSELVTLSNSEYSKSIPPYESDIFHPCRRSTLSAEGFNAPCRLPLIVADSIPVPFGWSVSLLSLFASFTTVNRVHLH
jgi:hypothetical protein